MQYVLQMSSQCGELRPTSGWQSFFLAFNIWHAHRRHLANTTEPSVCGGDAALCQITCCCCCWDVRACVRKVNETTQTCTGIYSSCSFLFLVNEIEMENNSTVSEINNMHAVLINCHNVILTARSMFDAITHPSLPRSPARRGWSGLAP